MGIIVLTMEFLLELFKYAFSAVIAIIIYRAVSPPSAQEKTEDAKPAESDAMQVDPQALCKLMHKRRSIFPKDFVEGDVPEEVINEMLDCANWAPTHGHTEPCRFVVLRSKEAIAEVQRIKLEHMEAALQDAPDKLEAFREKFAK